MRETKAGRKIARAVGQTRTKAAAQFGRGGKFARAAAAEGKGAPRPPGNKMLPPKARRGRIRTAK